MSGFTPIDASMLPNGGKPPAVTDELCEYARGYFAEITDEQILANYCVLRTLCTNERDKWARFRDGTAQETIPMVPIIDKFSGEIRPAFERSDR